MLREMLKRKDWRPALVLGVAVFVHICVFVLPDLLGAFRQWRWTVQGPPSSSSLAFETGAILCRITTVGIWVLSVFVTWATFHTSRRRAYLFLLAYFLMPLAVEPAKAIITRVRSLREIPEYRSTHGPEEDGNSEALGVVPARLAMRREVRLSLPFGPLLLLFGVWYLYRGEKRTAQQTSIRAS